MPMLLQDAQCDGDWECLQVGLYAGLGALVAQEVLSWSLKSFGGKLIGKDPGFLAHQLIALLFMIVLTVVGGAQWFQGDNVILPIGATSQERIFVDDKVSKWLASVVLGELILWDIPCSIWLVPSMFGDHLMLGHHIAMALVAFIGYTMIPSTYFHFFFGFCELSSIPLAIVDIFHPKKLEALANQSRFLQGLNGVSRFAFAVLFLVIRATYFPAVVIFSMTRDIFSVLPDARQDQVFPLVVILGCAIALTALQLYWAMLVVYQIVKIMFKKNQEKKD